MEKRQKVSKPKFEEYEILRLSAAQKFRVNLNAVGESCAITFIIIQRIDVDED